MNCALATASNRVRLGLLLGLTALLAVACAKDADGPESTVLSTRQGDTSIQVTESEQGGDQVVRISTTFRGQENNVVLKIDQPVYEVEIPLSVEQIMPQQQASAAGTPAGSDFQDLLIAQYLERAQEAMLNGDYNGALRQVNLVLLSKPEQVRALTMKGSIYYAMGNQALAREQWEQVLAIDPSNTEVNEFVDFLKSREGTQPELPGAPPKAPVGQGASQ